MKNILFICVANSARSQLAEAVSRHLCSNVQAWSAGSNPTHVRPQVRKVLFEEGIDTKGLRSKGLMEVPVDEMDLIISLCMEEQCPLLHTYAERLSWPLPDPASAPDDEAMEAFRACLDELKRRLPPVLAKLSSPTMATFSVDI